MLGYNISVSPFSPIWNNPSITCCKANTFKSWYDKGNQEFCHLFENGTLLSFAQLQQRYELPPHLFRFFQIRHVVNTENGSLQEPTPSKIDGILNIKKQNKEKVISKLYHVFIDSSVVNTDNIRQKWEQDLHMEIQK